MRDAEIDALNDPLPSLRENIRAYDPKDVFKMEEYGLFHQILPDKTI